MIVLQTAKTTNTTQQRCVVVRWTVVRSSIMKTSIRNFIQGFLEIGHPLPGSHADRAFRQSNFLLRAQHSDLFLRNTAQLISAMSKNRRFVRHRDDLTGASSGESTPYSGMMSASFSESSSYEDSMDQSRRSVATRRHPETFLSALEDYLLNELKVIVSSDEESDEETEEGEDSSDGEDSHYYYEDDPFTPMNDTAESSTFHGSSSMDSPRKVDLHVKTAPRRRRSLQPLQDRLAQFLDRTPLQQHQTGSSKNKHTAKELLTVVRRLSTGGEPSVARGDSRRPDDETPLSELRSHEFRWSPSNLQKASRARKISQQRANSAPPISNKSGRTEQSVDRLVSGPPILRNGKGTPYPATTPGGKRKNNVSFKDDPHDGDAASEMSRSLVLLSKVPGQGDEANSNGLGRPFRAMPRPEDCSTIAEDTVLFEEEEEMIEFGATTRSSEESSNIGGQSLWDNQKTWERWAPETPKTQATDQPKKLEIGEEYPPKPRENVGKYRLHRFRTGDTSKKSRRSLRSLRSSFTPNTERSFISRITRSECSQESLGSECDSPVDKPPQDSSSLPRTGRSDTSDACFRDEIRRVKGKAQAGTEAVEILRERSAAFNTPLSPTVEMPSRKAYVKKKLNNLFPQIRQRRQHNEHTQRHMSGVVPGVTPPPPPPPSAKDSTVASELPLTHKTEIQPALVETFDVDVVIENDAVELSDAAFPTDSVACTAVESSSQVGLRNVSDVNKGYQLEIRDGSSVTRVMNDLFGKATTPFGKNPHLKMKTISQDLTSPSQLFQMRPTGAIATESKGITPASQTARKTSESTGITAPCNRGPVSETSRSAPAAAGSTGSAAGSAETRKTNNKTKLDSTKNRNKYSMEPITNSVLDSSTESKSKISDERVLKVATSTPLGICDPQATCTESIFPLSTVEIKPNEMKQVQDEAISLYGLPTPTPTRTQDLLHLPVSELSTSIAGQERRDDSTSARQGESVRTPNNGNNILPVKIKKHGFRGMFRKALGMSVVQSLSTVDEQSESESEKNSAADTPRLTGNEDNVELSDILTVVRASGRTSSYSADEYSPVEGSQLDGSSQMDSATTASSKGAIGRLSKKEKEVARQLVKDLNIIAQIEGARKLTRDKTSQSAEEFNSRLKGIEASLEAMIMIDGMVRERMRKRKSKRKKKKKQGRKPQELVEAPDEAPRPLPSPQPSLFDIIYKDFSRAFLCNCGE